jgi:hypothetical protein
MLFSLTVSHCTILKVYLSEYSNCTCLCTALKPLEICIWAPVQVSLHRQCSTEISAGLSVHVTYLHTLFGLDYIIVRAHYYSLLWDNHIYNTLCIPCYYLSINPLKLNDAYIGRTALLTSRRCIIYIYIYIHTLYICILIYIYLFNKYTYWIF